MRGSCGGEGSGASPAGPAGWRLVLATTGCFLAPLAAAGAATMLAEGTDAKVGLAGAALVATAAAAALAARLVGRRARK